jgi:hypothetical protein
MTNDEVQAMVMEDDGWVAAPPLSGHDAAATLILNLQQELILKKEALASLTADFNSFKKRTLRVRHWRLSLKRTSLF